MAKKKSVEDYMSLSYPYELVLDQEQGGYFARHPDLPGCTAEGESPQEAVANLDESRRLWIEVRLEGGYPVPEPVGEDYRGRISLRIPRSLHASLARAAVRRDMSLNQLLTVILSEWSGGISVRDAVEEKLEGMVRTALSNPNTALAFPNAPVARAAATGLESAQPPRQFGENPMGALLNWPRGNQ
jgi:antitoxin HicB